MPTCRNRLRAASSLLGALAALVGQPSQADACSPTPTGWSVALRNTSLPSDGYLIVELHCFENCSSATTAPSIKVRDVATSVEVPGSVAPLPDVESPNLYAWRATNPLVAGGDYNVEVQYQILSRPTTSSIEVVPAGKPNLATMGLATSIGPLEVEAGEEICCPSGPLNTCGGNFCFHDRVERSVWVMLDWSLTTDAARFGQYLSRVSWEGRSESEPWNVGLAVVGNFDTAQAEYCYTLELLSLIDGSTERLERACIAHPDGIEVGVFDVDPKALESQFAVCEEPPEGKLAQWCDARAETEEPCSDADGGCSCTAAGVARRGGAAWALALIALGIAMRRARVKSRS